MRRLPVFASLVAAGTVIAACGSGSSTAQKSASGVVTISNESGQLWTCGFNPFNPSDNFLSLGIVYEPLVFVNDLKSGQTTPWLATAFDWSQNNTVLTFTIRPNVTWSDGKAFSAADVVYTFNLMKKTAALDLNSVWSVLSSVTQQGSDKVVMTFAQSAVPYFYYIADQVGIVPQHLWTAIANPVTDTVATPVGTGPFVMNKCTGQNIEYTRNAHYWQPGLPKIQKVEYPAFTSNDTANNYLANGQAQWGSQYIPNIQAIYTSKSAGHHSWFPPIANVSLFPNLTVKPLDNVTVRQALAYAIDRAKVSQIGETGYEPPANQTGVVTPTFSAWYDSGAASSFNYAFNPTKAVSLLESVGYRKASDGTMTGPDGKQLAFTVLNIGGYSDWVASLQVIQQELQQIGIKLTINNLSTDDYDNDLYNGKYQLAYGEEPLIGPSPYYELRQMLYSANTAPIGQAASTNYERYINKATDSLFDQYGSTTDVNQQHQLINQIEQVMLSDVPVIPVTEGVDWYQYDTTHLGGWVTPSDQFAQPAAFIYPDWEVMLLHLYPQ